MFTFNFLATTKEGLIIYQFERSSEREKALLDFLMKNQNDSDYEVLLVFTGEVSHMGLGMKVKSGDSADVESSTYDGL